MTVTDMQPDWNSLVTQLRESARAPVLVDHPLGPLTTYRVGGPARIFVEPVDLDDLSAIASVMKQVTVPVLTVGLGSNLLVASQGFAGLAIHLGESFAGIDVLDDDADDTADDAAVVRVGAAAALPRVARNTVASGLAGFEWAVGVPGSIGGAVRMNAGGHGSNMAASVVAALVLDLRAGTIESWGPDQLAFGYRSSALAAHHCVIQADLRLERGDRETGEQTLREIVRWRRENQPGGQNAGSVFTNPKDDSAGRLIDQAGCKGLRVGSAEVSTKHANFIQVDDGGDADDVAALMAMVHKRVAADTGVVLHAETHMIGFGSTVFDLTSEQTGDTK